MSEASTIFKTFTLEHGARKWELRRPNLGTQAKFAKHLERRDLELIRRHQDAMSELQFVASMDSWRQDCGVRNKYGWNRPGFHVALDDPDNIVHLVFLWIGQDYNAQSNGVDKGFLMTEGQVSEMWDDFEAKRREAGDGQRNPLVELVQEAINDPNPLRPRA